MRIKSAGSYAYLPYGEFLKIVKMRTGIPEKYIRDIMRSLPEILRQELSPSTVLRTPLGTFSYRVQESKTKRLPTGETVEVENLATVVLKSGKRLRLELTQEEFEFFLSM